MWRLGEEAIGPDGGGGLAPQRGGDDGLAPRRRRQGTPAAAPADEELGLGKKKISTLVAVGLGQEEDMALALGLVELQLAVPLALLDPLRVRACPLHEPVVIRRGDQDAAGPELPPLLRHANELTHGRSRPSLPALANSHVPWNEPR
ncbi:hypothetical protein [Oryza sativa Japonica Group]|uniref:Uncharacterized protein n=1 Tax=Oryza sativa subsp. japonica TaxID=39947 RepID=Q5VR37_ORYSJ|nr:hypothetical protein [Oryza sativa Japonica Group]BAD68088.1 hypothetical protein [Oryza sativa Japonica Group]